MPDLRDRLAARRSYWEPLPEDLEVEQYFTDAEEARRAFEALVAAEALARRVLVIHGVGGVGKSTLLQMYRLSCYHRGLPVAIVAAEDAPSSLDVLTRWAKDLGGMGVKLRRFAGTLEHYRALQVKVEKEARKTGEVLKGAAGELGKAAVQALVTVAATTAGVGPEIASMGGAGIGVAVEWLSRLLGKPDLELYMEPADRLAADFLKDIAGVNGRQRLVLMIDTYEQVGTLDKWVCSLAKELPANALLVIAGRKLPDWSRTWRGWKKHAEIVELPVMAGEDRSTLVRRYYAYLCEEEPTPELVDGIAVFARGLPLAATTAVELWDKHEIKDLAIVKAEVVDDIVDRLLEGVPADLRTALEAAAVLRYFDADSLGAVLGGRDPVSFERLRRWPFIRRRSEGYAVHDALRGAMNDALLANSRNHLQSLHQRAADHYEGRLKESEGEPWKLAALECLYHQFQVDEDRAVALLEELFENAQRTWLVDFQHKLLQDAVRHHWKNPQYCHRVAYLEARRIREWPQREHAHRKLLSEDLGDALRVRVMRELGESLSFQGKKTEASQCLLQALELSEGLGNPIETAWTRLQLSWRMTDPDVFLEQVSLAREAFRRAGDAYGEAIAELEAGYYYLGCWKADKAKEAFAHSLAIQERLGNRRDAAMARERLGQAYLIEGDFRRAAELKKEALGTFEELEDAWAIAWTLDELATCYIWTGQWADALTAVQRGKAIFEMLGDHRQVACLAREGEIYRLEGRFEEAIEVYRAATQKASLHTPWTTQEIYGGMAYIHAERCEFEDAREHYQKAIDAFRQESKEIEAKLVGNMYFGSLYLAEGRLAEAVQHYSACCEIAHQIGNRAFECGALAGICWANYRLGCGHQVEGKLREAEALAQQFNYDHLLAEVHRIRGHLALDSAGIDPTLLELATRFYGIALRHGLVYNRYELDETIAEIIAHCRQRGTDGQQVLAALLAKWSTEADENNMSLTAAERSARERERGDGAPQVSVIERIEKALERVEG